MIAYWCEHPELFAAIADQETPESMALAVLKWFIVRLFLMLQKTISATVFP